MRCTTKNAKEPYETEIEHILLILNLIYTETETLEKNYHGSYKQYRQELKLKLELHKIFLTIKESFSDADECLAFSLLEEEQK